MKLSTLSILAVVLVSAFSSCSKPEDVACDVATLCVKNTDPVLGVVYRWNGNSDYDTLLPGECAITTVQDLKIEFARDGSITSSSTSIVYFETNSATYAYEITECDMQVEAQGGFIDLTENCDNGIYNPESGETDLDCGGFCLPCGAPNLPCSLTANYVDWQTFGLIDSYSSNTLLSTVSGLTYTFNLSNANLSAQFHIDELPGDTKRFDIGNSNEQVTVIYSQSFSSFSASNGGHVYLVKDTNGDWDLKFCELDFEDGSIIITGSAQLSLQ